ncbi:hypothetical protein EW145_g4822 [Phellinidium pouzarii]|uniref:SUZ domain-containing protein n=1 Tax=Phellinidium pouzarii TaxID=167371 RepID=A0A4S4L6Z0_9AGAM|nr:hypothetical protein EW145_g4822 [Phellinidium pouzarii]
MSREEFDFCTSPDQGTPPDSAMPSSSRASSSSNLDENGVNDGLSDRLADFPLHSSSPSQTIPVRSTSDAQPQAESGADSSGSLTPDVDLQILEALKSKDRLFVLKLGEQMEALIREQQLSFEHEPTVRDKSSIRDMAVLITMESKIPTRRISELVPAEHTPHPTFKIMRRSDQDRRRQKSSISRPDSIAGEDGELSDPGPSETGSMGSRSTTSRKRMTIAEREAAYQEARSRIFMNFEEKEKAKERDTSASSSTFSLISASGSGSQSGGAGGSSISDIDDNASTAPTESEWSAPVTDLGRGGDSGMSSGGSTRSYRSASSPFNGGSGRASGTASPAITYPSLYDSSAHAVAYEPPGYMTPPGGYMASPYPFYAYPPHNAGQIPPGPYLAPYPYYHPPYPYGPPHQHPHSSSDPASPVAGPIDGYSHHAAVSYMGPGPYGWMPPPSTPQRHHPPPEGHPPPGSHQVHTPPMQGAPHMPYSPHQYQCMTSPGPLPYNGYPSYFQPPPQSHVPIIHPNSQPIYPIELPPTNGHGPDQDATSRVSSGNGSPSPTLSRHGNSSGNSNGQHYMGGNTNKRGAPPTRGVWSYGPGIGVHTNAPGSGIPFGSGISGNGGGETVGPRLSSAMRRTSGASSGSSGNRTPGEETASTASSSASSSSSRRTYMSVSKHPLPARPDWAAGLKAQPTLHPPTRTRHESNNSRNMSPARPHHQTNHHQSQQSTPQQLEPIFLQATDFPPLSSISNPSTDKRPSVGGAWSNPSPAARAILSPSTGHTNQAQGNAYGTALFNHSMVNGPGVPNRLEDDERGFERPPPKTSAELFNPKGGVNRMSQGQTPTSSLEKIEYEKTENERARGEIIASAILVDKVASLKLQDRPGCNENEDMQAVDGKPFDSSGVSPNIVKSGPGDAIAAVVSAGGS